MSLQGFFYEKNKDLSNNNTVISFGGVNKISSKERKKFKEGWF